MTDSQAVKTLFFSAIQSEENHLFSSMEMNEDYLRLAPSWSKANWFTKTKEDKLACLGLKSLLSGNSAQEPATAPSENTEVKPLKTIGIRGDTVRRFRNMVKTASLKYTAESAPENISNGNGNLSISTREVRSTPTSRRQYPASHWTQVAQSLMDQENDTFFWEDQGSIRSHPRVPPSPKSNPSQDQHSTGLRQQDEFPVYQSQGHSLKDENKISIPFCTRVTSMSCEFRQSPNWTLFAESLIDGYPSKKEECINSHEPKAQTEEAADQSPGQPPPSRWTKLAASLIDSYQDSPVCGRDRECHQPSPRHHPRSRWTQLAESLMDSYQDISPCKNNMDSPVTASPATLHLQEITTTNSTPSLSTVYFRKYFGSDFEIARVYELIQIPNVPSCFVTPEVLEDGKTYDVLGSGTFGRVITAKLADNQGTSMNIVVKELFDTNPTKIYAEARLLLYLERTGFVPSCFGIVSNVYTGAVFGILQECVGGGLTLDKYLREGIGKIAPICLLYIARQLSDGLREIHKLNVILNDIKSNNILLDITSGIPVVKYCDVGHATYAAGKSFGVMKNPDKFIFMAPEVRRGELTSKKSDVYSLGYVFKRIMRFGRFNYLVPVVDRAVTEDMEMRINIDNMAVMVNIVYNNHLEVKIMPDGQIWNNLEMWTYQNGEGDETQPRDILCQSVNDIRIDNFICRSKTSPIQATEPAIHSSFIDDIEENAEDGAGVEKERLVKVTSVSKRHIARKISIPVINDKYANIPSSSSSGFQVTEPAITAIRRKRRKTIPTKQTRSYQQQNIREEFMDYTAYEADHELSDDDFLTSVTKKWSPTSVNIVESANSPNLHTSPPHESQVVEQKGNPTPSTSAISDEATSSSVISADLEHPECSTSVSRMNIASGTSLRLCLDGQDFMNFESPSIYFSCESPNVVKSPSTTSCVSEGGEDDSNYDIEPFEDLRSLLAVILFAIIVLLVLKYFTIFRI